MRIVVDRNIPGKLIRGTSTAKVYVYFDGRYLQELAVFLGSRQKFKNGKTVTA